MNRTGAAPIIVLLFGLATFAQAPKNSDKMSIPISTRALLEGVKSRESRSVIKSVLMIVCRKDSLKGTGFVVSGEGIVTTNSHVIGSCSAEQLEGISSVSQNPIKFSKLVRDPNRDLALLCPTNQLSFSLDLSGDETPTIDTEVETWGYPLRYQDPAPILRRGYVAGYTLAKDSNGQPKNPPVQHLIVNGALNPGNSGGPLINRETGRVIGTVVEKWALWSPNVEMAIKGFANSAIRSSGTFSGTDANGKQVFVSDQAVLALVLKEFYDASQVMVGEAISVSELNVFIKEKKQELSCKQ
ncbi:MAG TPA: serine protease [Terriglobales bacterium]|jgi:hypothetical protein